MKHGDMAFPRLVTASHSDGGSSNFLNHEGMSLRDYFAAKALAGMLTQVDERVCPDQTPFREWQKTVAIEDARTCFTYADAMLIARAEVT